jgi:hypothetical protein
MPAPDGRLFMRLALLVSLIIVPCAAAEDSGDASKSHAEAFWKNNVRKQQGKLGSFSGEQILVVGTADAKVLESVGKAAERAVAFAKKSVGYDEKPVQRMNAPMYDRRNKWEGRLIVFVCKERHEFADLFTQMKSGRPGATETSAFFHEKAHRPRRRRRPQGRAGDRSGATGRRGDTYPPPRPRPDLVDHGLRPDAGL